MFSFGPMRPISMPAPTKASTIQLGQISVGSSGAVDERQPEEQSPSLGRSCPRMALDELAQPRGYMPTEFTCTGYQPPVDDLVEHGDGRQRAAAGAARR